MKNLAAIRGMHVKQWEKFLQLDNQYQHHQPLHNRYDESINLGGYTSYDSSGNPKYAGMDLQIDSRSSRYQYDPPDNCSVPKGHEAYGEFQHQSYEDYGKKYNRY